MRVLIYHSPGMDDTKIACRTVDEAINCFRTDAETVLQGDDDGYAISLTAAEMTEEQLANLAEV